MKKLLFGWILLFMAFYGMGQFVPQPLNYPGTGYWPVYISISDPQHVWIGTTHEEGLIFPFAAKTTNGGDLWTFDSIPVPGEPWCSSICEWDTNTCFFVFTDMTSYGGSIWKTTNGGETWANMTTNQFTGGFANFYHAFSADTGVAMGDPTDGYFEIQITNDGGATWNRVPSSDIPVPLTNEAGLNDAYSAVGNSIWFATNMGRCFRSSDKGQTWQVTQVVEGNNAPFDVCFSTGQKGAFWRGDYIGNDFVITTDGGVTWDSVSIPEGHSIGGMTSVGGFDGGFVLTAFKTLMDVYFTPDLFMNTILIESNVMSNGTVSFYDATTGWLAGGESGFNEIYKFTGVLTAVKEAEKDPGRLSIVPNPSATEALVKLPATDGIKSLVIRVTDMTGKVMEQRSIESSSAWITLNSTGYANGIYLVELLSGDKTLARARWVVRHW